MKQYNLSLFFSFFLYIFITDILFVVVQNDTLKYSKDRFSIDLLSTVNKMFVYCHVHGTRLNNNYILCSHRALTLYARLNSYMQAATQQHQVVCGSRSQLSAHRHTKHRKFRLTLHFEIYVILLYILRRVYYAHVLQASVYGSTDVRGTKISCN